MSAALSTLATLSLSRVIAATPMLAPMLALFCSQLEAVVAHRLADLLGDARGLLERAMLRQDAEFVAAEPRDDVGRTHVPLQQRGDVPQQAVAGRVPAGVVHDLELVQVDVQQRMARRRPRARSAAPPRAGCRIRGG